MMSDVSLGIGSVLLQWVSHQGLFQSLLWFGVLLVILTIGIAVVSWYRRMYWRGQDGGTEALTLDDLRRHYQQGRLTSEEYEALRKSVLGFSPTDQPK